MTGASAIDELWGEAPRPAGHLTREHLDALPDGARAWLARAVPVDTPLYGAVRLSMHGEIRLERDWIRFEAEEVLRWDRGFVWCAHTRMKGLPVSGFDRLIDGAGEMRWKLLGVVPVMRASGADVTRSSIGRMHMETIWLPTVLVGPDASWSISDGAEVSLSGHGGQTSMRIEVGERGELRSFRGERWGGPGNDAGRMVPFGGEVVRERELGGLLIPSEVRIGWYYGTDRFEDEGLFFRATVDEARFR